RPHPRRPGEGDGSRRPLLRARVRQPREAAPAARMRLLSFALWGAAARYTMGALRNAELAPAMYPGWICRFYCGTSVPPATRRRRALAHLPPVQVVDGPEPGDWRALFWRFRPAGEDDVEVMLSRDTDSRLGARERAAVDAWLASDCDFHVMRDPPLHRTSILAG